MCIVATYWTFIDKQYSVSKCDTKCDYNIVCTISISSFVGRKMCSILRSKELGDLSIEHNLLPTRSLVLMHVRHNVLYLNIQPFS